MDKEILDAINGLNKRFDVVEASLAEVKADVSELKSDVSKLKTDMIEVKADINELKADVNELKVDVNELKTDMSIVKITLENEVRPSIMRIAEGHLDLHRKMDHVLEFDKEREKLAIRVNYIDSEMRKMKKKSQRRA